MEYEKDLICATRFVGDAKTGFQIRFGSDNLTPVQSAVLTILIRVMVERWGSSRGIIVGFLLLLSFVAPRLMVSKFNYFQGVPSIESADADVGLKSNLHYIKYRA